MTQQDNYMTQKDRVYSFIYNRPNRLATTNALRSCGTYENPPIADAEKRARELYAQGYLTRRWVTKSEKEEWGLIADVMVYEVNNFMPYHNLLDKTAE